MHAFHTHESNADGDDSWTLVFLKHTQAGEVQPSYEPTYSPSSECVGGLVSQLPVVSRCDFPKNLGSILLGSGTGEFSNRELITEFSGEPYRVLTSIPITVHSLDIEAGVEAAFAEGNIAWVGDSRVDAINGLKAEILNTIEDFEANEDRLGPEPAHQLAILRSYLERTP